MLPQAARAIRAELAAKRSVLETAYQKSAQPRRLLTALAGITDEAVVRLWRLAQVPEIFALVAVGGFGRGELYPHSDVDVLVVVPAGGSAGLAAVEQFVSSLWDAGIDAGHSVRTIEECLSEAARDITVDTAMLESRHLAGDASLATRLQGALIGQRNSHDFIKAKLAEQAARHARFQDAAYNLEPNIKESPGGLRDLQTIGWLARCLALGVGWPALAEADIMSVDEAKDIARHERVLADLRIRLHFLAKRREDRLVFDHQNEIALNLKLASSASEKKRLRPSELLMRRYYLAAKAIWRYNSILTALLEQRVATRAERRVRPLSDEFVLVGDALDLAFDDAFAKRPGAILDAFRTLQEHADAAHLGPTLLRELQRNLFRIDAAFRADPANRARFLSLFEGERLTYILRRMSRYGVLGRYLPVFGRIVGQMQHDLFHVYTVDEHTLMVVRNLRRFAIQRFNHEFPLASELAQGFDRYRLLYMAALFHDIAKGRGGDHSDLGAADATRFCRQHRLNKSDQDLVVWLVREHLTMSATAQKKDLSDPDVIAAFAAKVRTERYLHALYLFTVADVRGTSPHVWNAWKGKLLEDLLRRTRALLRGDTAYNETWLNSKKTEALRILAQYLQDVDRVKPLWAHLDTSFFQRFEAAEIGWATRTLWSRKDAERPIVRARLSPAGEGIQVLLYARDREGLFARVTSYFERLALNIASAKVYTTQHGYALDIFQVMGRSLSLQGHKDLLDAIEIELAAAVASNEPLPPPVTGRSARVARHFPIPVEVKVRPLAVTGRFEVSVLAADRPGLLSRVARVLHAHGVNLHDARVATLGARAEDTFEVEGELDHPERQHQLVREIEAVLTAPAR